MGHTRRIKHAKRKSLGYYFKFKVFAIYFVILVAIFAWIDYYADEIFNLAPFILVSLLTAIIATIIHIRSGKKSEVDDLAEKL